MSKKPISPTFPESSTEQKGGGYQSEQLTTPQKRGRSQSYPSTSSSYSDYIPGVDRLPFIPYPVVKRPSLPTGRTYHFGGVDDIRPVMGLEPIYPTRQISQKNNDDDAIMELFGGAENMEQIGMRVLGISNIEEYRTLMNEWSEKQKEFEQREKQEKQKEQEERRIKKNKQRYENRKKERKGPKDNN